MHFRLELMLYCSRRIAGAKLMFFRGESKLSYPPQDTSFFAKSPTPYLYIRVGDWCPAVLLHDSGILPFEHIGCS